MMDCTPISIHAPRKGSDPGHSCRFPAGSVFQSTLPVRGATLMAQQKKEILEISIHAPRKGSDVGSGVQHHGDLDFNPRSP